MRTILFVLGFLVLALPSCATAESSASRTQFIVAHEHGWIELKIVDSAVLPALEEGDPDNATWAKPACSISLLLNSEPFLREPLYPHGESPPYRVESGFRFPVPAAELALELRYSGCPSSEESRELALSETVGVGTGQVLPLTFDGNSLDVGTPYEDTTASLDSVSRQLEELSRGSE